MSFWWITGDAIERVCDIIWFSTFQLFENFASELVLIFLFPEQSEGLKSMQQFWQI